MKRILILFTILLVAVSACKKGSKSEVVDPRDQYVGTYDTEFTSQTKIGDLTLNKDTGKGTITFTKGDAADELKVNIIFSAYAINDVAKLNGNQFTLGLQRDKLGPLGFPAKTYDAAYAGSGTFSGNTTTIKVSWKATEGSTSIIRDGEYKGTKR